MYIPSTVPSISIHNILFLHILFILFIHVSYILFCSCCCCWSVLTMMNKTNKKLSFTILERVSMCVCLFYFLCLCHRLYVFSLEKTKAKTIGVKLEVCICF
ncbi:hypothetical protein BCR42DRAFT_425738 [Absidia repens]|uniref:Uncharacterized protein n=1 Tax=Absidia repens TaxID=90262 RepID=A0A1X2I2T3_9FUNG|nr:hypothetical protein BCR42DRAFT_425738 [Absidia repens]